MDGTGQRQRTQEGHCELETDVVVVSQHLIKWGPECVGMTQRAGKEWRGHPSKDVGGGRTVGPRWAQWWPAVPQSWQILPPSHPFIPHAQTIPHVPKQG